MIPLYAMAAFAAASLNAAQGGDFFMSVVYGIFGACFAALYQVMNKK